MSEDLSKMSQYLKFDELPTSCSQGLINCLCVTKWKKKSLGHKQNRSAGMPSVKQKKLFGLAWTFLTLHPKFFNAKLKEL